MKLDDAMTPVRELPAFQTRSATPIRRLGARFDPEVLAATRALFEGRWDLSLPRARTIPEHGPAPTLSEQLSLTTFVAFRNTDGVVGILTEHCRHRQVLLVIGRCEGNGFVVCFTGGNSPSTSP